MKGVGMWGKKHKKSKERSKKVIDYVLAKRVVRGVSVGFVLVFVGVFIRMLVITQQVLHLQQDIKTLTEQQQAVEKVSDIDHRALQFFMSDFLDIYVNVPKDSEAIKTREQQLKPFYAVGVNQSPLTHATREKKNYSFVGLKREKERYVAIFWVHYVVSEPVEKEKTEQDKVIKTVELKQTEVSNYVAIPFVYEYDKFVIVSEPYPTSRPEYTLSGHVVQTLKLSDSDRVDTQEVKGVHAFLEQFFKKFVVGNRDELKYMMSEPFGLDGRLTFFKIEKLDVYTHGQGELQALVKVGFKDMGGFVFQTHFSVVLTHQDGKYVIRDIQYIN
ncbi:MULTISPECIES: conjugal transfer protein [unclassified Granulicatella]|uniref:conjugal transfer protein n=1 Tax=unclassified Granulicatella TaxID=2630493 RepID=UPI001073B385|nr:MULTISPECIES: conjugal transfer protein [unclassified Granulicatella]MBF0780671.1 conjugal transfer protein [Granulicatella sp. 19428wC4_WM01]TFU94248.1 hypothetical protein E4T68_06135 [Granulicatella sp. WM01]